MRDYLKTQKSFTIYPFSKIYYKKNMGQLTKFDTCRICVFKIIKVARNEERGKQPAM